MRARRPLLPGFLCALGMIILSATPVPAEEARGADAGASWWAFRPVEKPQSPRLENDGWSRTPIDHFVLARLAAKGLEPAPPADRVTLLRRLYFDLIGVPPAPGEIDRFLADRTEDAWERQVDALLGDERYGEHWARYWLDLVRYCESDGWNQDAYRPHVWRYRDYVVAAFNEDKPYPEFVREQLAGDEIGADDPEHLAATGFLRLGIYEYNQRDARGQWNDILNELTDVTGDVFLGVSMGCARCHDHKFDPIPQRDYFGLRAFFEPLVWRDDIPGATRRERREHTFQESRWEAATRPVRARIDALLAPYYERKWKSTVDKFPLDIQACFHKPVEERTSWEHQMAYLVSRQFLEEGGGPLANMKKEDRERYEALQKELAGFDALRPEPLPELMTATDFPGALTPTVIPGDPEQRPVRPHFLSVLEPVLDPEPDLGEDLRVATLPTSASAAGDLARTGAGLAPESTGRRTALAQWIGEPANPLTTRVVVNRIWQQHFGAGLVSTPSDFGRTGQPPTHPALLDWLSATFVEGGWRLKPLHRLIVTSSVWRQSALHPHARAQQALDPAGALLWRAPVRRLTAEQIRDSMLSASGELDARLGGPSVDADAPRRALYVKRFRNQTETFLHSFDAAAGLKSVAVRNTTTTPTQALLLLNGEYTIERARQLAAHLSAARFATPAALVRHAVRQAWGRAPSAAEIVRSLELVCGSGAAEPIDAAPMAIDAAGLVDFCHVLFNSNEFLYVD